MTTTIQFYSTKAEYGCFSNFARYPVVIGGKVWPTTEHYYQAQKFKNSEIQEQIRRAQRPMEAARMGRDRKLPLRRDWESIKLDVMRDALHAKFTQHEDIREVLLSTGDAKLVEHTTHDAFWADGGDGSGENWLGRILMEVRDELRNG